jgi:uncharacterized protein (TIGR03083 family)
LTLPDLTYTAQFEVLRVWIGTLQPAELGGPSALPGWTVADLIGHLVGLGRTISTLQPAEADFEPISIAAYVSNYAAASGQSAQAARDITGHAGAALLTQLDRSNTEAQRTLDRFGGIDQTVVSRRGPIMLSNFLDTGLIELVVHSGDLARSLPDHRAPIILPSAERRVLAVLRELLTGRAGDPVEALAAASALPPAEFVELATGRRVPPTNLPPALAGALPLF